MKTFKEECEEWLKPFGYNIHSYSADNKSFVFINDDLESKCYPAINCFINENNEKRCIIYDNIPYKLFLKLTTGELEFKHKDLNQYIKIFDYYGTMAERYPPFWKLKIIDNPIR